MLKTVSSVANALGALNYKGTWNATTNTPTLASGVGTQGDYYVVSVAGTTDLDGITNWGVGDWAAFNGSVWQRVEGGADGNFVNLDVSNTGDFGGKVKVTTAGNGEIEVERTSGALINLQAQSARGVIGTNSNHELQLKSNSTGRLKITTAGNVEVMSGNLVIATSGKGIDFSATAGSGTSELFSDYEEGVFTPSSFTNLASTSITPGASASYSGSYTKIGRTVTCYVDINLNTSGTSVVVGDVWSVAGLPYTSAGDFISGGGVVTVYGSLGSNILAQIAVSTKGTTAYFRPIQITGAVNYNYPIRGFFVFSV
jgi:hypothetical protein